MSQQETFEKLRDLRTSGTPEIRLIADAISVFVEQLSRVTQEVTKLKNDVQQLKSVRGKMH